MLDKWFPKRKFPTYEGELLIESNIFTSLPPSVLGGATFTTAGSSGYITAGGAGLSTSGGGGGGYIQNTLVTNQLSANGSMPLATLCIDGSTTSSYAVSFSNVATNQEIVRLNRDGSVVWADGIEIDEAADAFGRSIRLSAEIQSGITEGVKHRMRDTVFNELIDIAREKGFLTAEDLTYLLEASKIVEKLKGGN